MVKKNIINTIKKHNLINANEHIVIGLSGGPDSVCLFSVLNEWKDDLGITLHAVHVNHGFRPGAADEDQKYVETLCAECGVESTSFLYDCNAIAEEHGLSSEEAGRKVRYESFWKIAAELVQKGIPEEKIKIAVAHNADDQAETVLFRLLRGTGTDGLAGMAYAVTGSRALKSATVVGAAIHLFAGIVGLLIMLALAIVGAADLLTPINILLFELIWMIPGLLVTQWTRLV
jgi:tRNA(Ile)-lysidine synthase